MVEDFLNIVAVVGSATFAGVMLCIGVTLGAYWRSLPGDEFLEWFSHNHRYVARSIPIAFAPTFIALAGSVAADWGNSDGWLWLMATLAVSTVIAITGAYFVPANRRFADGGVEDAVEQVIDDSCTEQSKINGQSVRKCQIRSCLSVHVRHPHSRFSHLSQ